jgi:hypothetical protein
MMAATRKILTCRRLWIACVGVAMMLCLHAADFTAPAPGPVAFRIDRIPLNRDTMRKLAADLVTTASGLPGATAAERQAIARALAMAVALEPAPEIPRQLLAVYQNGRRPPAPDAANLATSHARVWRLIGWLESPEAGAPAGTLADCLKDVMAYADFKHPRAAALREAGARGAWTGWVPDIHAYEPQQASTAPQPWPETASIESPATPATEIRLATARAGAVASQPSAAGNSTLRKFTPIELQMTAAPVEDGADQPFTLEITSRDGGRRFEKPADNILRLLEAHHGRLPSGMSVRIITSDNAAHGTPIRGEANQFTAAAAVLASAAITGTEPDAIIIGNILPNGGFTTGAGFWYQLQALDPEDRRRVILPVTAAAWLKSMLAMESPGFFLNHEICVAADFKQLLERSAKSPEGAMAQATAAFREVRHRAGNQDIRTYLDNRFVRQRLEDISKAAPFHASAAMLFLQASGNRPVEVDRRVLAAELRLAIEPMSWIPDVINIIPGGEDVGKYVTSHDQARAAVERMAPYTARTDLDLLEKARATTAALRAFQRSADSRNVDLKVWTETLKNHTDFIRMRQEVSAALECESSGRTP